MQNPLVTVLMPVYNAEAYVDKAIESILNQTYKDFEFLIIDDGSTDRSFEIISSYTDSRISCLQNKENIRLIATLNKGIELSSGKYICRMDADDICTKDRIEKQYNFMENKPEYAACSSWISVFTEKSTQSRVSTYLEQHDDIRLCSLYQNHFCHAASFIRKSSINDTQIRFDKDFIHAEDYHFFVRLSEKHKLYIIPEPFYKMRKHTENVSVLNADTQKENSVKVIKYQLEKIGIDPDSVNFDVYFRFFYASFDLDKNEIEHIEAWLIQLIEANKKSNYLPQDKLTEFLCNKWLHLCLNSCRHGLWIYSKFNASPLRQFIQINTSKKIIFALKSIFRIKHIPS